MHAQDAESFKHFKACRAYETAFALKAEGKVRHVGMTFYDRAEVLNQILNECPQIEVVQIQLNYVDFEDPAVQSCASDCIKCGQCEKVCPQHLHIRELLQDAAKEFEKA